MAAMQDDALKALISDLGEGIVIDPELLEGCSVAAHDLDDMDAAQAAEVAAHVFFTLFETKVLEQTGESAEPEEGEWSGLVMVTLWWISVKLHPSLPAMLEVGPNIVLEFVCDS